MTLHFNVYMSVTVCFLIQIVLLNDFVGYICEVYMHMLSTAIYWHIELNVLITTVMCFAFFVDIMLFRCAFTSVRSPVGVLQLPG